jgi:hypothetical protein
MAFQYQVNPEDRAGYNQAARITEILAMIRLTFTSAMLEEPNNFHDALESCRGTINIISGKVKAEIVEELNKDVYKIEGLLPKAKEVYEHKGFKYFKNTEVRIQIKRELEKLWRNLEKLQDEYGYGMSSEEDTGL